MPCIVKKTFEEAAAAGALLIAQVKDNQPTLHQRAEQVCQTSIPVDQTTTKDAKRRSRDETRVVEVFDPNAALADTEWADHVGAIIRVSRTTHARQTATGLGRRPASSRISSASSCCPPVFDRPVMADRLSAEGGGQQELADEIRDLAGRLPNAGSGLARVSSTGDPNDGAD